MNTDVIIKIDGVFKKYTRDVFASRWQSLQEYLKALFGVSRYSCVTANEFWALKSIDLQINRGESVALIGKNGCGKSTLLKVIAGILSVEKGQVYVGGKIQALINLGAGFERNLTGRENIINACSLFGESDAKGVVQEIIEFSELGEFIDNPISGYSSGMYARLGFSLATHLTPDILLIDEILAVGDVAFKNKCMAKIFELKKRGVTIILVSHSHSQVAQLCERAIWINDGEVIKQGNCKDVLLDYLSFMEEKDSNKINRIKNKNINSESLEKAVAAGLYGPIYESSNCISNIDVEINGGYGDFSINLHEELVIKYSFYLNSQVKNLNVSVNIYTPEGELITTISTLNGDILKHKELGEVKCTLKIQGINLAPGRYVLLMPIHEGHSYLYRHVIGEFWVKTPKELTWGKMNFKYQYKAQG